VGGGGWIIVFLYSSDVSWRLFTIGQKVQRTDRPDFSHGHGETTIWNTYSNIEGERDSRF
jgi:hypothetical protein